MTASRASTELLDDGAPMPTDDSAPRPGRWRRWRGLQPLTTIEPSAGPHVRLLLVLAALADLALIGVGSLWSQNLFAAGVVAFLVVGVGTGPALLLRSAATSTLLLLAVAISCSTTVLIGLAMAWTAHWHPTAALVAAVLVAGGWLLVELARSRRDLPAASASALTAVWQSSWTAWALALVGALFTVLAAAAHSAESPARGGLLTVLSPVWFAGVSLLLVAALIATWTRCSPALPLLLLTLPVVTAQAIVYRAPTVMVAARHVGVVQYITAHGSLDPSIDIYQAWAGLFAGVAWMVDAGHIGDPLTTVAAFAPSVLTATTVLAVRVLAGQLGLSRNRAWWTAAASALGSTLSQVYFAPQSVGFFLAVTVIAISLRAAGQAGRRRRVGHALLLVLISSAIAVTHEISPYLAVAALLCLYAFRLVPGWSAAAVVVPAIVWAWVNFDQVKYYFSPSAVGDVVSNVRPPSLSYNDYPESLTARMTYGLPAVVLALIGLFALVSWWQRRDRRAWALLLTAASPASLAFGSDYGQEVIFRVALFALPWLVVAIGFLRLPAQAVRGVLAVGAVVLVAVNAYGMTGMDYARTMRATEAAQLAGLERSAPAGTVVYSLGTGAASPYRLTANYLGVQYSVLTFHGTDAHLPVAPTAAEARTAVDELAAVVRGAGPAVYVDISVGASGYDDLYGIQRAADFEKYARAFAASAQWRAVSTTPDATIYELRA